MNIKKPLMVAGVASVIALGGASGMSVVSAATGSESPDATGGLIDKIASKFNLNKEEVKAVFEEEKTEREAERQKYFEEKLDQAVSDGTITTEQKEQIISKAVELKTFHESIKDKTRSEQRELMKTKMAEVKQWAEDNNIPNEYLHPGKGHGGHGGLPPAESRSSFSTN